MYIPPAFCVENPEKLADLMRDHSFATVITHDGRDSFASHLPVLFDPDRGPHGTLMGHMARGNPQWGHFSQETEVLVIFHGPHAYISPSMYETAPAVPTWNYAVVHAYGVPGIIEDRDRLADLLDQTVTAYESGRPKPWTGAMPPEFRDKLMLGIVGFEIQITRIDGKFKLGQNRPIADQRRVYAELSDSDDTSEKGVAALMLRECPEMTQE